MILFITFVLFITNSCQIHENFNVPKTDANASHELVDEPSVVGTYVFMGTQFKRIDLSGQKFSRLKVLEFSHINKHGGSCFKCICDCGESITVSSQSLKEGNTRSCGCLAYDNRHYTHGDTMNGASKEYAIFIAMYTRCYSPNHKHYHRYGGRGITVCDRWLHNYPNFLADMGRKPDGKSLDRIDNDKGYSPENCKWATRKEQAENRSTNVKITHNGETLTVTEWSSRLNGCPYLVGGRLRLGWNPIEAITTPINSPLCLLLRVNLSCH